MTHLSRILVLTAILASSSRADDPFRGPPSKPSQLADFKLKIDLFGVRKEPIARAELVVRDGIAYQFIKEYPEEVTIIGLRQTRVHLLDLSRKTRTVLTSLQLDAGLNLRRQQALAGSERRSRSGGKADLVSAAISRDLFDPHLRVTPAAPHSLSLTNPAIEIEAVGSPEPDETRRKTIQNCLAMLAKIDALREPKLPPPFGRLQTFDTVSDGYRLRPTEITVLYRLAGRLQKWRWTYDLIPALTDREREAVDRIDKFWASVPVLRFDRYEEPEDE